VSLGNVSRSGPQHARWPAASKWGRPVTDTSRDRQREATRQRLYEAALGIFRRDGFREARVDDITLVAGVSRTAFYFHFPTKEDVLSEMMRRTEQPICAAVEALPADADLSQVLETVVEGMNRVWQGERDLIVDAMAVGLRIESGAPQAGLKALLARRLEAASARGVVTTALRPAMLADLYLLGCMSTMVQWAQDEGRSLHDALTAATGLFLDGARNGKSHPKGNGANGKS